MSDMRLYTAEEFAELDAEDERYELVRGVVERRDIGRPAQGYTAGMMIYVIRDYIESRPIGIGFAAVGYVTERDPDTVRVPEVSFVTHERLKGPGNFAPDLAIEMRSAVNRPIAEYFANGARLVWFADSEKKTVEVYAPEARPYVVQCGELLDGGGVLPGFRVEVKKFFGYLP